MLQNVDQQIRTMIANSRENANRGLLNESERLLRMAEMQHPHHPLVINERAMRALNSGDPARAVTLLEPVQRDTATDPDIWYTLTVAYRKLGNTEKALEAVDKLLAATPASLNGLLEKGILEQLQGRPRDAAMSFRAALQVLPPGFAAPPWLETQLQQARAAVDANNNALENFIGEGLSNIRARYANMAFQRFDQCVDMLLQKRSVFRQQPSFMFFPELPAIEFYDRADFAWIQAVEAATDDIREELLTVMHDGSDALDPYVQLTEDSDHWHELNHSRRWGVYSLWREGLPFEEHIARCPRTVAAIEACPRWRVRDNGPTALFSILDAKTHIPAHSGAVNTRLLVHLPLIVPPNCRFRVGGQYREWRPGEALIFDDSINHEAWNDSDEQRAVLIFDVWSPFLNDEERELVSALTGLIGDYYGKTSNTVR